MTSRRPEIRRQDRAERKVAFNHESASAARLRHIADRKGKPRRPKKSKLKKPYDPLDHVHPRHQRAWLRANQSRVAAA